MSEFPITGNQKVDEVLAGLVELQGDAGERLAALTKAQEALSTILDDSRSSHGENAS